MDIYLPPNTAISTLPPLGPASSAAQGAGGPPGAASRGAVGGSPQPTVAGAGAEAGAPSPVPAAEGAAADARADVGGRGQLELVAPSADGAPVVLFCHGGVWATGAKWHYSPMATRLAQAGVITAVMQVKWQCWSWLRSQRHASDGCDQGRPALLLFVIASGMQSDACPLLPSVAGQLSWPPLPSAV
jgi:hypothetical protein